VFLLEEDMIIHSLLCKNTYIIRDVLSVDKDKKSYSQKFPTEYYIATVLNEIIKFLTSVIRWEDDFKDGFNKEKEDTLVGNLIIQGLYDEINLYYRKLIEAFTNLLLWKELNNDDYVRYYYLIKEYNDLRNEVRDLKDFYGIESNTISAQIDNLKNLLKQESANIDESLCFFININTQAEDINGTALHLKESSYREKLKKALLVADSIDKLLLGFSYRQYSLASTKIHFNPFAEKLSSDILGSTIKLIFILIYKIVFLCSEILSVSDLEEMKSIETLIDKLKTSIGWYTPITNDIYDVDDYVFTLDGKMGRIEEKITSTYGYKSYKIHFLDDNGEGIVDDFFPAQNFRRIQPKEKLYEMVFKAQPAFKQLYELSPDEDRLRDCLDNSLKVVWQLILKDKYIK